MGGAKGNSEQTSRGMKTHNSSNDLKCGAHLAVIFCGFISHLIGCKTINIPEILSGVHGFTVKTD